ncbi:MAG TPA: DUF1622 domain-containing protein [Thermomicrobiales bacterium]|nr:DUF1622 domain-containing protein [Thermomicrobiales bacterium]
MEFQKTVEVVGKAVEATGVAVIVIGILLAGIRNAGAAFGDEPHRGFRRVRQAVARSILLGLELLIAGDIIRTVAVDPTFTSVGVLALIVLVRTFISIELELEISGRWPWQRKEEQ